MLFKFQWDIEKLWQELGFGPGFFQYPSPLRLDMIRYNQIWWTKFNRTQKQKLLTTGKSTKDQLIEINKNIEKFANTEKVSLAIVCLTLLWLKAFLKMLGCLIWINRLLKTPTTLLYWLMLTGSISREI